MLPPSGDPQVLAAAGKPGHLRTHHPNIYLHLHVTLCLVCICLSSSPEHMATVPRAPQLQTDLVSCRLYTQRPNFHRNPRSEVPGGRELGGILFLPAHWLTCARWCGQRAHPQSHPRPG